MLETQSARFFPKRHINASFRLYWNLVYTYLKPVWPGMFILSILLLSSVGLQLLNPQILQRIIDDALSSHGMANFTDLSLLYIGVTLVAQVLSVCATYMSTNVGWIATNKLRADLTRHALSLDMAFHNRHTPGEMIERLDGDITLLTNFFSQLTIQIVGNGVLLLGILVLLFRVDWRVGLSLMFFVVLSLFTLIKLRSEAVTASVAARQNSADLYGFLEERLSGTEDIRANGATAYIKQGFQRLLQGQLRTQRRAGLVTGVMVNASTTLIYLGTSIAFAVGTYLFFRHRITIGVVYLIYSYTRLISRPIDLITQQINDLQNVGASITRVQELLQIKNTIKSSAAHEVLQPGALAVAYQNVSFGYNDVDAILHDISISVEPGKVLGILGRTGSGKTTLTRLLLRLYEPTSGAVLLGGKDICTIAIADVRKYIGVVTQDIQLFSASIRNNLTFFDPSIPDQRMLDAIKELGLWEWYCNLPQGLDTELAPNGNNLSAGQAQLLALTRIFLKNPGVIILDEASSRLDPATEQMIEQAINTLLHNRTAIIIAHRLSTVQRADDILILEKGHVKEFGKRKELLMQPASHFASLLQNEQQLHRKR